MINKDIKNKVLEFYNKKEDKLFASIIVDKINKFEIGNSLVHTNFLDMNEESIAISILNKLSVEYYIFKPLDDTQKSVIFLLPDYILKEDINEIFSKYICVLKIKPDVKCKLTHREYMGTIYSLGLKHEMIGDIFVYNDCGFVFCFIKNSEYILDNLYSVSKTSVKLERLPLDSDEVKNIKVKYKEIEIIVPSLRIDSVLSAVFCLSRTQVKQKIQSGDLYINSKEMFFVAYAVLESDVISFSKFGKFKIGEILRNTKSGKTVLKIYKYS